MHTIAHTIAHTGSSRSGRRKRSQPRYLLDNLCAPFHPHVSVFRSQQAEAADGGEKKKGFVAPTQSQCAACEKTVYLTEKLVVDNVVYHKVRDDGSVVHMLCSISFRTRGLRGLPCV
jgi:hypothetical protein